MRKIAAILNILVFVLATLTIGGFIYQGFALERYFTVSVMIITTDGLFILSTAMNLLFYRGEKVVRTLSVISMLIIAVAIVTRFLGIEYPPIALTFWWLYIWLYYGFLLKIKRKDNYSERII